MGRVENLADLCVCLGMSVGERPLGHLRFCEDDRVACMPIAMALRDRSFDVTTASFDVFSLSLM